MRTEQSPNEVAKDTNMEKTPEVSFQQMERGGERFDPKEQLVALRRIASLAESSNT